MQFFMLWALDFRETQWMNPTTGTPTRTIQNLRHFLLMWLMSATEVNLERETMKFREFLLLILWNSSLEKKMLHSSSHSSRTPSTWSMKRWRISKIKIKVLSWLSELRFWKKTQNYQSLLSYQVCTLEGQVASATKALTKAKSQKMFLSVPLTLL